MPVIRSQYTTEQFEEALQKMAHEIPKFSQVRSEDETINFYGHRISVQMHKPTGKKTKWGAEEVDYWGFTIEDKNYVSSNHVTKIDVAEQNVERFNKFIEDLMKGVSIVPRFSLKTQVPKRATK